MSGSRKKSFAEAPLPMEIMDEERLHELTNTCDVLTVFLCTVNPKLDEDQVFTILFRIFDDEKGLTLDNAVTWGRLVASTEHGRASEHLN